MHAHRFLAVAAAAGALATLPAGAAAAPAARIVSADYDVAFDGAYHLDAVEGDPGTMEATRAVGLTWHADTAQSVQLDKAKTGQTRVAETETPTTSLDGAYHQVDHLIDGGVTHQDCTLAQAGPASKGIVGASTDDHGTVTLDVEPFGVLSGTQTCTRPASDPSVAFLGHAFAKQVTFPAGRIGDESIVIPVTSDAGPPCPSYALTISCDAGWTGQITLTRRGFVTESDRPGTAPAPAPAQSSSNLDDIDVPSLVEPTSPAVHPTPVTGTGVPWLPPVGGISWDPVHGVLTFPAACAGGCDGTLQFLAAPGPGGHAAAARKPIAARFTVARSAARRTVRVGLSPRARRALRRTGRGTVTVTLRDRVSGRHASVRRTVKAH